MCVLKEDNIYILYQVTAHLLARVALFTNMDEKLNPFGRNSMTLWKCRRVMTDKWLNMGEDEYDAPYPRMFSAVKGRVARWLEQNLKL